MTDPESRLARVEERSLENTEELKRARDRLHSLEADRITIALLTEKISSLAEEMRRLVDQMHGVALRAAGEAVTIALAARDKAGMNQRRFQMQSIVTGAAIATVIITIIFHFV